MANSIATYSDEQIMRALITHDFSGIGRRFEDDEVTKLKTGAFFGATNLDEVVVPNVTSIGHYCFSTSTLSSLTIDWTKLEYIGVSAFEAAFNMLPETLDLQKLTVMGPASFAGSASSKNTKITSVNLPVWTGSSAAETSFPSTTGIFANCSNLASVSAPSLVAVPQNCFNNCASLTEVSFPKASSIQGWAFDGCNELTKVDIGGATTAFTTVFLPTGSSSKLTAFILRGVTAVPTITSTTFNNTRVQAGTCYIYVPSSMVDLFKLASGWSNYADQIRAIESYPEITGGM